MFMKGYACSLFLSPQDEVGLSSSSSVVLCSFGFLVDIVVLVLVFYLCPFSVRVVATFPGTVLFPLLCSVLPYFPPHTLILSLSSFVIPGKCLKNFICAASDINCGCAKTIYNKVGHNASSLCVSTRNCIWGQQK